MIKIVMTDTCTDCPCSDLELEKYEISVPTGAENFWTIRCIHEDACERMEKMGKDLYEDDLK